jgi:predicted nucleotidyltransferase component of viral defense system
MKNAMQLKAYVKNIAKEKDISAQLVLQNYMLERYLERVSLSEYRDKYIIKGGFLIASLVGLESRATMDLDATIKGYPVNEDSIRSMVESIISVPVDDGISFQIKDIGLIREDDEYGGIRVSLNANYEKMAVPLKLDITTGDKITPGEIEYSYKLMMEERSISILSYNLSTILAEKLETVVSRGDQNTRPRDYYDIFILSKLQDKNIEIDTLRDALIATSEKRGSKEIMENYEEIIKDVSENEVMNQRWNDYRKDFSYASEIEFRDACERVITILDRIALS